MIEEDVRPEGEQLDDNDPIIDPEIEQIDENVVEPAEITEGMKRRAAKRKARQAAANQ